MSDALSQWLDEVEAMRRWAESARSEVVVAEARLARAMQMVERLSGGQREGGDC